MANIKWTAAKLMTLRHLCKIKPTLSDIVVGMQEIYNEPFTKSQITGAIDNHKVVRPPTVTFSVTVFEKDRSKARSVLQDALTTQKPLVTPLVFNFVENRNKGKNNGK